MGADQSKINSTIQQAFHVLRVDEHSPAANAKLMPYFDYIISVNGVEILQEIPNVVSEMAKNHIDRPMKMLVYNSRHDNVREVTIIPCRNWGGKTLLGASIRYCQVTDAADRVWHVVDVTLNSPSHDAGLIPMKDWIIGALDIAINTTDDFYNLMIHNQKRLVRLLVFNLDNESVREVTVVPDFGWGGEGCLGCDVASGALHRIPPPHDIGIPKNTAPIQRPAYDESSFKPSLQNEEVVVIDSPLPTQVQEEKVEAPINTAQTIHVKSAKTNLLPIPGFDNNSSNDSDLSFLQ